MADDDVTPTPPQTLVSAAQAPYVYFDLAPVFGCPNGVVQVTLTATSPLPTLEGGVANGFNIVGYLRCSRGAAISLREALDKALLMDAPVTGEAN